MSSFPQEHLPRVLRLLVVGDNVWRDKILATPGQYRVHSSHFRDEDKEIRRGKLTVKPDALPVATVHLPAAALPSEDKRLSNKQPDRARPVLADITGPTAGLPSQRQLFPQGSPKRRRLGMGRTVLTPKHAGFQNPNDYTLCTISAPHPLPDTFHPQSFGERW